MLSTRNPLSSVKWAESCPSGQHTHQYFAYGADLDPKQMKKRCPSAEYVTRAVLPNHEIGFDHFSKRWSGGVLDVEESRHEQVAGVLYQVPHDEIRNLDGEKDDYQRSHFQVYPVDDEGVVNAENPIDAEIYDVPSGERNVPPTPAYLKTLIDGARHWNLPEEYIAKIKGLAESLMPRKPQTD
jgi:hypothetical protein